MTTQDVKRRLAAILSAGVDGNNRLMGEDEVGTIRTQPAGRQDKKPIQTQRRTHGC